MYLKFTHLLPFQPIINIKCIKVIFYLLAGILSFWNPYVGPLSPAPELAFSPPSMLTWYVCSSWVTWYRSPADWRHSIFDAAQCSWISWKLQWYNIPLSAVLSKTLLHHFKATRGGFHSTCWPGPNLLSVLLIE